MAPHKKVSRWRSPVLHPILDVAAAWYSVNSATTRVRISHSVMSWPAMSCARSYHSPYFPVLNTPMRSGRSSLSHKAHPVPVKPGSIDSSELNFSTLLFLQPTSCNQVGRDDTSVGGRVS